MDEMDSRLNQSFKLIQPFEPFHCESGRIHTLEIDSIDLKIIPKPQS